MIYKNIEVAISFSEEYKNGDQENCQRQIKLLLWKEFK